MTMKFCNSRPLKSLIILVTAVLLTGCVSGGLGGGGTPEQIVAKRAQSWVDALMKGDLEKAYSYTSPNYRKFSTAKLYHARVAGISGWDSAVVDSVTCEIERCTVVFMVEYEVAMQKLNIRRPREYRWTLIDDAWWLYVPPR